jgi:hypothetical protein
MEAPLAHGFSYGAIADSNKVNDGVDMVAVFA